MNYRMLAATALACGTIGGAALAQQEEGRVLVDLVNVQADIAAELGIDASAVPMNVMAPVGVAAEACGVEASSLAPGRTDGDSVASGGSDGGAGGGTLGAGGSDGASATGDNSTGDTTEGGDGAGGDAGADGSAGGVTGDNSTGDTTEPAADGTASADATGAAGGTGGDTGNGESDATCIASTSSTALAQFVKQEMDGSTTP